MQITREKILKYLESHSPASAGEISRYLEMTTANIRYHLDILEAAGFVCRSGNRSAGSAGRPVLLYSLASVTLGNNLNPLLGAFLKDLHQNGRTDLDSARIAENLTQGKLEESRNRVQRLNEGVAFLNKMHYHATWEARPQGPQLELRHCPYQDLALIHPALCQLDEKLLRLIFGIELKLVQKRTFGKNPFSPCVFL